METVQRKATRLSVGLSRLNYEERLRCLRLSTLHVQCGRGDFIQTWRKLHNDYSVDIKDLFQLNRDTRLRGH